MQRNNAHRGGVRFHITHDMIRNYRKMPIEMRLAWLEDAAKFSYEAIPPKRRRIWEKFRRGEI